MTASLSNDDTTKRVLFRDFDEDDGTFPNPSSEEGDGTSSEVSPSKSPRHELALDSKSHEKYALPQCQLPPLSELEPVEVFVMNAINSKLEASPDPAHVQGYKALVDSIRRPTDPNMIRNVLISLRTAGNGTVLTSIATNPTVHAQLIHVIFRFSPMGPQAAPKGDEEAMKRHEANAKIYSQMHVMDAHLHFMLALVSAKAAHLIPVMTAVWRLLTTYSTLSETV
eukprot:scaffold1900_cov123-Cylindrotheca_fusiformis.AAC.15